MKTSARPVPKQPKGPAPLLSRQLTITFVTPMLQGLDDNLRVAAVQALATILLQAAGVQLPEDDNVQR